MNVSLRRVGGIWFWRIGRLGGSVYLSRKRVPVTEPTFAGSPVYYRRTALLCGRVSPL